MACRQDTFMIAILAIDIRFIMPELLCAATDSYEGRHRPNVLTPVRGRFASLCQ